ncbi:hypothetical protein [Nocardia sp. NPDC004722]
MSTFPSPYSIETKSTALELLEQARQAGMKQSDACVVVAEEFENGPAVSTLHAWARESGIFKAHRGKHKRTSKTRVAPVITITAEPVAAKAPIVSTAPTAANPDIASLQRENAQLAGEVEGNKREIKALRGLVMHYMRPAA